MKINVYNQFSLELKNSWIELEKESDISIFQTFEWNKSWFETIGLKKGAQLYIVLVLHNDKPIIIFPFILKKSFGFKIISFIGDQQSDYLCPLINSSLDIDFKNTWSLVTKSLPNHDLIYLEKYTLFGNHANINFASVLNLKEVNISHSSSLPKTFEAFNLKLRPKLKSDINRQKRRLSKLGKLEFQIITDSNEFKKLVPEMILQKRKRYKKTNVPDPFINEDVHNFYINIVDIKSNNLIPHYSILKLGDKIIATHWGVIHKSRFYYLMPTYSADFMVYSPGKILLYFLIEESISQKLKVFDFTIGGESYKNEWCNDSLQIFYYLKSMSFKGVLYKSFLLLINYARQNKFIWDNIRKAYRLINEFKC